MNTTNPLIVALDVETLDEAKALVMKLGDSVEIYKIGSQLFTSYGPQAVREIAAMGKKIFLDLKFHDIPNTVAKAVESAITITSLRGSPKDDRSNPRVDEIVSPSGLAMTPLFMLTVHTIGGREMMEAAASAAKKKAQELGVARPLIVGVTVLTSDTATGNTSQTVLERARLAIESGLDGVVASPQETAMIRKEFGSQFVIVTPGIRSNDAATDDQKRIATPADAISAGSNYLVVGRPIVKALSPQIAAQKILDEIRNI